MMSPMSYPQTPTHDDIVAEILTTGRRETVSPSSGLPHPRGVIKLYDGRDEVTIRLGNDGKWRYSGHSTYGNYSGVYGCPADDASGHVITAPALLARLNALA